jgi:general secretion pathway protein N
MTESSKRWVGYALIASSVYLGFVLVTLPASALSWTLARFSTGTIVLEQPRGTVWSGTGVLRLASPPVSPTVRWEFLPSRLLRAAVAVRIEAQNDHTQLQAELRRDFWGWSAHDLKVALPAELVPTLLPAARLLAPQGDIRVTADTLRFEPGTLNGTAEVVWANAGTEMMNLQALGQYRIALEGRGPEVHVRANTESGDLDITAEGVWKAFSDGSLHVQGTASARGRQQELEPLLRTIGPPRPDGARSFNVRTQLPILPH